MPALLFLKTLNILKIKELYKLKKYASDICIQYDIYIFNIQVTYIQYTHCNKQFWTKSLK